MSGKVYICDDGIFPYGNAGANRILNIAKCLQLIGKEIKIIGLSSSNERKIGAIENVNYVGCALSNISLKSRIDKKLLSGKIIISELEEYHFDDNDVIYIYGTNCLFVSGLLKFAKSRNIKTIIDVVEWHQPYQYKLGKFAPQYISAERTVTKLAPKAGNIIAISELLGSYYSKMGVHTTVIPPIIDINHAYNCEINNDIQLIYPGNPIKKDDIIEMLEGLALLSMAELDRVYFHITGVSKSEIINCLGDKKVLVNKLGSHVIFHEHLTYTELCEMYLKVDFVYMCKPDNKVNKANFPSKIPELMSYGVIPICNKIGDFQNYINDNENAILFEHNNSKEASIAIRRAIGLGVNDRKVLKINARKCAERQFDFRVWCDRLEDFVCGLM